MTPIKNSELTPENTAPDVTRYTFNHILYAVLFFNNKLTRPITIGYKIPTMDACTDHSVFSVLASTELS